MGVGVMAMLAVSATTGMAAQGVGAPMATDRVLEVLPEGDPARALSVAARELGDWSIELAGVEVDGALLERAATAAPDEPLVRHVRELLGRPVDVGDFVLWLDDVLVAGRTGRRGEKLVVPSGRARAAGILLHPDDVFRDRPRRYGADRAPLAVDEPQEPEEYAAALDGEPLGPRWTARYLDPSSREQCLEALRRKRPGSDLAERVDGLLAQLEEQGAQVWLTSTVRSRERGYLMWGAYLLSRAQPNELAPAIARLRSLNSEWKLDVPISWAHPDGARATRDAARRMADAYRVVHASEGGARNSSHYGGGAVDMVALALPRKLTLRAPDGATRTFDLSAPAHARDLSLEPELIRWIEVHFGLHKLTSDYPHWSDTRP
jgi:hypothetical protein